MSKEPELKDKSRAHIIRRMGGIMDKKYCNGCYQDRYNHKGMCERPGIDAPVASDNCWNLESAVRVRRVEIPIHQTPPYHQKSRWIPDCYSRSGFIYVDPKRISGGYIK